MRAHCRRRGRNDDDNLKQFVKASLRSFFPTQACHTRSAAPSRVCKNTNHPAISGLEKCASMAVHVFLTRWLAVDWKKVAGFKMRNRVGINEGTGPPPRRRGGG